MHAPPPTHPEPHTEELKSPLLWTFPHSVPPEAYKVDVIIFTSRGGNLGLTGVQSVSRGHKAAYGRTVFKTRQFYILCE